MKINWNESLFLEARVWIYYISHLMLIRARDKFSVRKWYLTVVFETKKGFSLFPENPKINYVFVIHTCEEKLFPLIYSSPKWPYKVSFVLRPFTLFTEDSHNPFKIDTSCIFDLSYSSFSRSHSWHFHDAVLRTLERTEIVNFSQYYIISLVEVYDSKFTTTRWSKSRPANLQNEKHKCSA